MCSGKCSRRGRRIVWYVASCVGREGAPQRLGAVASGRSLRRGLLLMWPRESLWCYSPSPCGPWRGYSRVSDGPLGRSCRALRPSSTRHTVRCAVFVSQFSMSGHMELWWIEEDDGGRRKVTVTFQSPLPALNKGRSPGETPEDHRKNETYYSWLSPVSSLAATAWSVPGSGARA